MPELHVIFGAGAVGQAIASELITRDRRVRMVNRSGRRPADLPESVEMFGGDAYNRDFARAAAEGAAVVYQTVGLPYDQWVRRFPPLQASILEAAGSAGARFVVAENLYMYGDPNGQPIHEDLPFSPHTRKGKVRAAMAEALMEAHRSGRVRAVAVRTSDFYGPAALNSTMGATVFIPAVQGKTAAVVGNPNLPHTHTYIGDFAKAMAMLGERPQAEGQAWHVPSGEPLTQAELVRLFFEEIGRPFKLRSYNRLVLSLAGIFVPEARESVEMLYEFDKPFIMSSRKFEQAFGNIATPHRTAMQATAAWYQEHFSQQEKSRGA
ncbi:MAG TPA: NAD-dependent epimerase/dehydratase family protein [Anaerolineales bacterium]